MPLACFAVFFLWECVSGLRVGMLIGLGVFRFGAFWRCVPGLDGFDF